MEKLLEYWQIILGGIGLVVWLGRLEAGMLRNREDIRRLEAQRASDLERTETHRMKLDDKLAEIHQDLRNLAVLIQNKADR